MPTIPRFDNDANLRPGGAAQVSPGAMAAVGNALSRVGDEQTEVMTQFLARRTEARRSADAAHVKAEASGALDTIQHQWSLVPDRDQAQAGFDKDAAALRDKVLGGISDPYVQSHVSQSLDSEIAVRRHDTTNTAFGRESSAYRGKMDTDVAGLAESAANASNDLLRAKLTDDGIAIIKSAVAGGWLAPEAGDKAILKFKSDVPEVQARKLMNAAIDSEDGEAAHAVAARLSDPEDFKGLLPERREILQGRLESLGYRLDQRAAARVAHADSVADRNLRKAQGHNEAMLLAGIADGKPVSAAQIQHMADTQQISAGGVEALTAANVRAENGVDKADPTLQLWHGIGTGQVTSGMIFDAMHRGDVSRNTANTMMRALDRDANKQESAVERGAFNTVKTALNGGAIEQGFIKDATPKAMWAQAQNEWNSRVKIGGENPLQVKDDILKRYSADAAVPTWLPQPQLGVVKSRADLEKVTAQTGAAFKAGTIDQARYAAQLQLLSQYKSYFPAPAAPKQQGAKP